MTGAAGMLGGDIVSACVERGHEVLPMARGELDITDASAVDEFLAHYRPDVVVDCAAWTDVDGAEDNEAAAMRVNDTGAGVLAAAAANVGAKILYPSSDYVFDGSRRRPYVESDMPSPLSTYGRSKQGGETTVEVANPRHFIVRSSWLFGLGGRNFVETMLRLGNEQPEVLVVSDQVGCPTYTRHLAAALAALVESEAYGIHHIAVGLQEYFVQGVEAIVARFASEPLVLGTELTSALVLPHWRQGLTAYLAERELAGAGPGGALA